MLEDYSQNVHESKAIIPAGTTSIPNLAFSHCSKLTSIEIPNSVTIIGENAFYGCSGLIDPNRFDSQKRSAHGASEDDELEEPNLAMCVLSFLFPIVGFISAMINSGSNKRKSKAYAKWAGIGFLLNFVLSILQSL